MMDPRALTAMQHIDQTQIDSFARDLAAAASEQGVVLDEAGTEAAFLNACGQGWFGASALAAATGAQESAPAPHMTPENDFYAGYAKRHAGDAEQRRIEEIATQAEDDAQAFERRLGRPMTDREATRLADEQRAQVERGGSLDVDQAASAVGIKPYHEMDGGEQARLMAERAREMGGQEDELEVPVARNLDGEGFAPDWSEMSQREINRYLAARARGAELSFED